MPSLLQSPLSILSHSSSTSSPSYPFTSLTSFLPTDFHSPNRCRFIASTTTTTSKPQRWNHLLRSSLDDVTAPLKSEVIDPLKSDLIAPLKVKLLSAVSGLNRGLAANEDDIQKADAAAKEVEAFGGPVDLSNDFDKLQGRWKLLYSSAFSSRTLGGSRPGPPVGRLLPISLGQVFQRIDILSKDFDNIVNLQLGAPWPLEPIELTATLAHKFERIGSSGIKITFEKTTVKTSGNLSQLPPLEIPRIPDALRPPSNTGHGEFEVTFLDADTRITRGDKGELRVFVIS